MKIVFYRLFNKITNRNYSYIWVSFAILIASVFLTISISNNVRYQEETQSQKEFVLVCNEMKLKIATRINLQAQFLHSGSSLFEASNSVSRKEWKVFNTFSKADENYMGVQGYGYATIVKKEELKEHINTIRKEGLKDYKIFPEGERAIYTSILYLEPLDKTNSHAIGYDMFSEQVRRTAMEKARDYNVPALSGKVQLLLKTQNKIQAGTLLYVPVYKKGPIQTVAQRRKAIRGWVYIPFRMDDLVESILRGWDLNGKKNIRLQIYDGNTVSLKTLLFDSSKNSIKTIDSADTRKLSLPFIFNQKEWTLVFSEPIENVFFYSSKTQGFFIGGIIISLLLFALAYSLLITKDRAKKMASQLTLDLEKKNKAFEEMNQKLNVKNNQLVIYQKELKDTNEQLQKAIVKAEESDQLKSAFLANMSHEIRTPMNGILGFTELLKETKLSKEDHKNYIEIIEKSGTRLLCIINDIIDISKIEAKQMNVSLSITNVDEQMQYIQHFFAPEAREKEIQLILKESSNRKKTIIRTDSEKLYAILINLVKNAIKYTFKGTIEFGYEIKGDRIEFFVKDTGIGIPEVRQKAIFERFIQADYNDKMARQGAGLGLSIAKSYVELLNGSISVESKVKKGSTFYFTLPYVSEIEENTNDVYLNPIPGELKRLKILVAEDDNISRMLILKVLKEYSDEILTAYTGLEAVEICRNNPDLDLILMDVQMPEMDGYTATVEIRKFNKDIIILAQTAFALQGDKEKTIESGCNGYISKPIKKTELSSKLQHYFGKKQ